MKDFRHNIKVNKLVILTGLFFMVNFQILSQRFELPADSLIIKNKVHKITSYFHYDSSDSELSNIWIFDKKGRIVSNQLFDEEDSTLDIELFFYDNNLLIEEWHIGTWLQHDTVKTKYYYNNQNKVTKEIRTGSHIPNKDKVNLRFTNTITYSYSNNNTLIKKYEASDNFFRNSGIDSLIYNIKNELIYCFNLNIGIKTSYKYNNRNQLIQITNSSLTDTNRTQSSIDFLYKNGYLTKEIQKWTGLNYKYISNAYPNEIIYLYDDRNLYKKIIRENNFDTYEYEFY